MNPEESRWLKIFRELSSVPRRSGDHSRITPWILEWAGKNGFNAEKDKSDNIRIDILPSKGYEDHPGIVLQGHMDMVCEKIPGSGHDFTSDPLKLVKHGEWLKAEGTSLGADNGIAIALAFDLLTDPDVKHPGVEILITSDEEIGLVGAQLLEPGFLKGRRLINLDSEEEGVLTIGCAGGRDTDIFLKVERAPADSNQVFLTISVGGLTGGHSGIDIAKHRANANVLLIRFLRETVKDLPFRLVSFNGGTAHNAIPRDSSAVISVNTGDVPSWMERGKRYESLFLSEWTLETGLKISCRTKEDPSSGNLIPVSESDTVKILRFLRSLPHGVQAFSNVLPGFVETSTNLAIVRLDEKGLRVLTNQRSSIPSRLLSLADRISALSELIGAEVRNGYSYPPWPPRSESPLLDLAVSVWNDFAGKKPVVEMTHAGLECGIIGDHYPGMEMISLGPDIVGPHSPDEKLNMASADRVRSYLAALLSRL